MKHFESQAYFGCCGCSQSFPIAANFGFFLTCSAVPPTEVLSFLLYFFQCAASPGLLSQVSGLGTKSRPTWRMWSSGIVMYKMPCPLCVNCNAPIPHPSEDTTFRVIQLEMESKVWARGRSITRSQHHYHHKSGGARGRPVGCNINHGRSWKMMDDRSRTRIIV